MQRLFQTFPKIHTLKRATLAPASPSHTLSHTHTTHTTRTHTHTHTHGRPPDADAVLSVAWGMGAPRRSLALLYDRVYGHTTGTPTLVRCIVDALLALIRQ